MVNGCAMRIQMIAWCIDISTITNSFPHCFGSSVQCCQDKTKLLLVACGRQCQLICLLPKIKTKCSSQCEFRTSLNEMPGSINMSIDEGIITNTVRRCAGVNEYVEQGGLHTTLACNARPCNQSECIVNLFLKAGRFFFCFVDNDGSNPCDISRKRSVPCRVLSNEPQQIGAFKKSI